MTLDSTTARLWKWRFASHGDCNRTVGDSMSGDTPLEQLFGVFDRLPFVSNVKKDVAALRSLLYLRRPPRLACVGDIRGGRSAVAEALFGEAGLPLDGSHRGSWVGLSARGARVDWLELDPESAAPPDKEVLATRAARPASRGGTARRSGGSTVRAPPGGSMRLRRS